MQSDRFTTRWTNALGRFLKLLYQWLYFPPALIFVAIMIATTSGWQTAQASLDQDITTAATGRIASIEQILQERMQAYEQLLRGGVGLFQGSSEVTAADWKNYLDAFDLPKNYAGAQGIGFAQATGSGELVRVLYVETPSNKPSPLAGMELSANPLQQQTMRRAQDSGAMAIAPPSQLLPPTTSFTIYAPYFDVRMPTTTATERQAALRGFVFAAIQAPVFLQHAARTADAEALGFYVTAHNQTIYQSPTYQTINRQTQALHLTRPLYFFDQTWTLHVALNPEVLISQVLLKRPANVLFFGIFSALLISTIVFLLLRSRSRDLNVQKEKAVELAKDELLSLASHQLRTPATGVKQYVGMVLQGFAGKVPKLQRELLEKAYASNDRQMRIINEVLHLAKIDAGRIVLAKQEINLSELITDIVAEQQPDILAANHTLKTTLPKRPLMIRADMHMLRMAIENVLSNAIKYTPSGGHVDVQLSRELASAVITITDTGVGIKPTDIPKIFQQFSRLPNPMSQQVGGTGIGLYLAKHLVGLHKGSIRVESTPGKGSNFSIKLPLGNRPIKNLTVRPKS